MTALPIPIEVLEERIAGLKRRVEILEGSVPVEKLAELDSETHHIEKRAMEDRSKLERIDRRLQVVESAIATNNRMMRYAMALLVAIAGAVVKQMVAP